MLVASCGCVYKHETEGNDVLFEPTLSVCPPTLLLNSLEKNCSARTNTYFMDARKSSFIWLLMSYKVITDVSHDLFTLALVSKEQNTANGSWWKFHVSCPRPKLQVYPQMCPRANTTIVPSTQVPTDPTQIKADPKLTITLTVRRTTSTIASHEHTQVHVSVHSHTYMCTHAHTLVCGCTGLWANWADLLLKNTAILLLMCHVYQQMTD